MKRRTSSRHMTRQLVAACGLAIVAAAARPAAAQLRTPTDIAFTYQGQLKVSGVPLSGSCDVRFRLFDDPAAGSQIGSTLFLLNNVLSSGLLTVDLDFSNFAFPTPFDGTGRWLEVSVRSPAGAGSYTLLTPRQPILPTPYALYALNGNPGPQGPAGPQGAAGAQGVQGAPGSQGAPGAQGSQGAQGADGAPGAQGSQGPQGAPGSAGAQGPMGASPFVIAPDGTASYDHALHADGGLRVGSFFDVFTDVSLHDTSGGASSTATMRLRESPTLSRPSVSITDSALDVSGALSVMGGAVMVRESPSLPSRGRISSFFDISLDRSPDPTAGAPALHFVDGADSSSVMLRESPTLQRPSLAVDSPLDISGAVSMMGGAVMVRESPTLPSRGRLSSFFDVFLERAPDPTAGAPALHFVDGASSSSLTVRESPTLQSTVLSMDSGLEVTGSASLAGGGLRVRESPSRRISSFFDIYLESTAGAPDPALHFADGSSLSSAASLASSATVAGLQSQVSALDAQLASLTVTVQDHSSSLSSLQTQVNDQGALIINVRDRVNSLESQVTALGLLTSAHSTAISGLQSSVADLSAASSTNAQNIGLLVSTVSGQESRISTMEHGTFHIDSFFDVFTDATLDSGLHVTGGGGGGGGAGGMVGIGTRSPQAPLDVAGAAVFNGNVVIGSLVESKVGIGVSNPTASLDVAGDGRFRVHSFFDVFPELSATPSLHVENGRVGINEPLPFATLHVGGNMRVDGDMEVTGPPAPGTTVPVELMQLSLASASLQFKDLIDSDLMRMDLSGGRTVELGSASSPLSTVDVHAPMTVDGKLTVASISFPDNTHLSSANGLQGPQGATGATGSQGEPGAQGVQGAQGATGAQGPQGAQGAPGSNGLDGAQGAQGPAGPTGATGGGGIAGFAQAVGAVSQTLTASNALRFLELTPTGTLSTSVNLTEGQRVLVMVSVTFGGGDANSQSTGVNNFNICTQQTAPAGGAITQLLPTEVPITMAQARQTVACRQFMFTVPAGGTGTYQIGACYTQAGANGTSVWPNITYSQILATHPMSNGTGVLTVQVFN